MKENVIICGMMLWVFVLVTVVVCAAIRHLIKARAYFFACAFSAMLVPAMGLIYLWGQSLWRAL